MPLPRERKEVEAESVAYLVAAEAGLDTSPYSFPYIARWANGDLDLIRQAGERSVTAARTLTADLEAHLTRELQPTTAVSDPLAPASVAPDLTVAQPALELD